MWRPPDNATPLNFLFPKSWDQELSADVSFVSVIAMVLSEYWKSLEENFRNKIISAISQNDENYKNIFSPAFFSILKEPLLVQKQTLHQQKALDLSYLEPEGQGRGSFMRVRLPFGAKSIFCWFFTGAWRVFFWGIVYFNTYQYGFFQNLEVSRILEMTAPCIIEISFGFLTF